MTFTRNLYHVLIATDCHAAPNQQSGSVAGAPPNQQLQPVAGDAKNYFT